MERRLAAVLAADVVGYSTLMGRDEVRTLSALRSLLYDTISPVLEGLQGRFVKHMGDGFLAEFPSVVRAVEAAVEMQEAVRKVQKGPGAADEIRFRIGINIGDILVDGDDLFGDGINVAARLEKLAEPGGICISAAALRQVEDKVPFRFEPLGEVSLKNIARRIEAFHLPAGGGRADAPGPGGAKSKGQPRALSRSGRWALSLSTLIVVAVAAAFYLPSYLDPPGSEGADGQAAHDALPSITVHPFRDLSAAGDQQVFADGLVDDLTNDLTKIAGLVVISHSPAPEAAGPSAGPADVGSPGGAQFVLEGSFRRGDGRIRVNARLVEIATGRAVWAERYDEPQGDLFAVQDAVIAEIVEALAVTLTIDERARIDRVPTTSLEAYEAYSRARAAALRTTDPAAMRLALSEFRRAFEIDPQFADAYAGYAQTNVEIWRLGMTSVATGAVALERARHAANFALEIDPESARGHTVLAIIALTQKRLDEAMAHARRATDLVPGDAEAHAHLAYVLAYAGRREESLEAIDRALRLAPRPSDYERTIAGVVYFIGERYEAAVAIWEAGGSLPASENGHVFLSAALARLGREEAAATAFEPVFDAYPSMCLRYLAIAYDFFADPEDRDRLIDALASFGVPEWPFGYEPREEDRVTGAELQDIVVGRTWSGQHESGLAFFQFFDDSGRSVYRSTISSVSGSAEVTDDELCLRFDAFLLGREYCTRVYRSRDPEAPDYLAVSPISLQIFDVRN